MANINHILKRYIKLASMALGVMWMSFSVQAASRDEVENFVDQAATYAKEVGKITALKTFSDRQGQFTKNELYIYAYDFEGVVLAHGAAPQLVGKNLMKLTDPEGTRVIYELNELAKHGSGWLRFYWDNPLKKKVMPKLGYVVKVDETYWIGSGVYLDE